MIIVEERPLLTAPAVGGTPAGDRPAPPPAADGPAAADGPVGVGVDRPNRQEPGRASDQDAGRDPRRGPRRAAAVEDSSLALAMASIRISRGNPTVEETAALAVLLTARLRRLHEDRQPEPAAPSARRLPHAPCPQFRPPGAWAS